MKLVVNVFGERRHFILPKNARKTIKLLSGDYVVFRVLEINDEPLPEFLQNIPVVSRTMMSGTTSIAMSIYPVFKELIRVQPGDRLTIDVIAALKMDGDKLDVFWRNDRETQSGK